MSSQSNGSHIPRWLGLPHRRRGQRRSYGTTSQEQTNTGTISLQQYYLMLAIIALITLACINMAFAMAPGLPTNPEVSERIHFLAQHTLRWQIGWLNWMAAAIGLLVFCVMLTQYIPHGMTRTVGLLLVAIGIAPDISAEVIYAFILPAVEQEAQFMLLDRIAMLLTGFVGNGAYCLGGLLLNLALFRNRILSRGMLLFGLPSWLFGLLISVNTALNHIETAGVFTAIAMTWNVLWMFWFTQTVLHNPLQDARYD